MAAPKGNQYAKGKATGKPKIWDDDAISEMATRLRQFIADDKGVYLNSFCIQEKIDPDYLSEWARSNEDFSGALREAKSWQEHKFIMKSLTREWDGNFAKYAMARLCGDKWKASYEQPDSSTIEHIGNVTINKVSKK
jgi:hypothetical protein